DANPPWASAIHLGGNSYWKFTPSNVVLNGYETVQFLVSKIITPLNVPKDKFSLMYVQINNIPGYNDASFAVSLQKKEAEATVDTFTCNKDSIKIGENVKLSWTTSLAKKVTIEYEDRDGKLITLDSDKGDIKLNATDFLLPTPPNAPTT